MTRQGIRAYLADNPLLSALGEDAINFLAGHVATRRVAQGEAVFRRGEPADTFYMVRSGRISVEIPSVYGPPLQIQSLGAGELVGWSWLISPYRWDFQARAEEDAELLEFDGRIVLEHCEQEPAFGYHIYKQFAGLMSERLSEARQRMMDHWSPAGFA